MKTRDIRSFIFGTLRGRLILGVAIVHAVMMTLFILDLTFRQHNMLLDRQEEIAIALSKSLSISASEWLAAHDVSGLQELVEAQGSYPELIFAILIDENGQVLAHTDKNRKGQYLLDLPKEVHETVLNKSPELEDVVEPSLLGGIHVGWVRVGISQKEAGKKINEITFDGTLYAFAAILIGSIIAWFMGRRITRRLYAVQNTISQIRIGNRTARSKITGHDEAASIATEFNIMLDTLDEQEYALARSEFKYQQLIQNIQAGVVVHSPDTRIVISNLMAQELLGLKKEQMLGRASIDSAWYFLREDGTIMPVEEYPVTRAIREMKPIHEMVIGIKHPETNSITWALAKANPMFDQKGTLLEVIVTFIDITNRKKAEEQLYKLNRVYAVLSNINQAVVRIHDTKKLFNEACRIAVEYGKFQMVWVGMVNLETDKIEVVASNGVIGDYLEKINIDLNDELLSAGPAGAAIKTGRHKISNDIENDKNMIPWRERALKYNYRSCASFPLIVFNKVIGAFLIYSNEINFFGEEDIYLLDEMTKDISFAMEFIETENKRKKSEEMLREQYSTLRGIIDSTDALIFSLDKQYYYTSFNRGHASVMKTIYGVDIEVGHNLLDYMTVVEDRETAKQNLDRALIGEQFIEESYSGEELRSRLYFQVSHNPIRTETGDIIGVAVFSQDITVRKRAEEALFEGQKVFRTLVENSPDIIARYDRTCKRTYVNPMYLKVAQISEKELLSTSPIQRSPLSAANAIILQNLLRKVLENGIAEAVDVLWPMSDNIDHWYNIYAYPELDRAGNIESVMTISRDITDRKRAEEHVLRLNRVYSVLSNINQTIVRIHETNELLNQACKIAVDDGKFRMAWVGMVNVQTNKIDVVASFGVTGDYLEKINIDLNDKIQSSGPTGIAIKTGFHRVSNNIQNDVSMIPWRESAIEYGYKSSAAFPLIVFGKVVGIFNIYSDKTDFFFEEDINLFDEMVNDISFALEYIETETNRKHMEEVLQKTKILLEQTIMQSPVPMVLVSMPDVIIRYVNPATRHFLGIDDEPDLTNTPLMDIKPSWQDFDLQGKEGFLEDLPLVRSLKGIKTEGEERCIVRKDGTIRYELVSGAPIFDNNGEVIAGYLIMMDITERKHVEDALFFVAQRGWQTGKENFFDALAQFIGEKLNMDYVLIDRIDENPDMAETVALYSKGAITPNMRYALKGTPCENVMGKRLCVYPHSIQQLFPEDTLLPGMGAESYIGIPLWDSIGRSIGLIAVMGIKPLTDDAPVTQLLQLVATRAAAELERKLSEEALETERKRMEIILSALNTGLSLINPDMTIAWVNNKIREMFPVGEPVGQVCHVFYEFRETICEGCGTMQALINGKVIESEQLVPSTGRWYYIISLPIKDATGSVMNVLEGITDITERKFAEKALHESEWRYREIFDNVLDSLFLLEVSSDGHFRNLEINPAFEKSTGLAREQLIGKFIEETVPPEVAAIVNAKYRHCVEAGHPIEEEAVLVLPPGKRYFHSTLIPAYDQTGRIYHIIGISRDITEQKEAERKLKLLNFALNNVYEEAYLINEKACFDYVNDESCRILGYSREELLTMNVADVDPDFPLELWPEHWNEIMEHGSMIFEGHHKTKEGRIYPVEISANYFEYNSQGYNLALARNITDRKQAEEEHKSHLRYFENMDKVNRAIQGTNDLNQMMSDVLDIVLTIFDCDRTFLVYPCDPNATSWCVPMERTKPEYPGAKAFDLEIPMDQDVAETFRTQLAFKGPVKFGPGAELPLPFKASEQFGFKSLISMALYPKLDKPWQFGLHQCSYPRVWTQEEERLLQEIGRRLTDALTSLLVDQDHQESEERYRRITEGITDYQYSVKVENGKAIRTMQSPACFTITGYQPEEFYLDPYLWIYMVAPEDREMVQERVQQILDGKEIPPLDHRIIRKDGEVRWVTDMIIQFKDASGKLLSYDGVIKDITDRKRAEETIQESELRYRTLANSGHALIWASGIDMLCNYFNSIWLEFTGRTLEQEMGNGWTEGVHPDDLPQCLKIYISAFDKREIFNMEYRLRRYDGEYRWIIDNGCPQYNNKGEFIGYIGHCLDITDRKLAEEEIRKSNRMLEEALAKLKEAQKQVLHQEKMRSLGQLASGIAHDINNSLTPIMGYVDMLSDDTDVMKMYGNDINMIIKSTQNISRTIGRMREFYKIKLTDEDLKEKNINTIINSSIELTRHKWKDIAESSGSIIEIRKEFQDDLPLIMVDDSEIIEALTNIILNACDAMPDGGELTFKTYQNENNIIIQIIDTGFGMKEEILNRCMDPFFTTKGDRGTGLGLSMVYGVIERHKGEIKIESEPNKGTNISLILPIVKGINEDTDKKEFQKLIRPLKILSMEDDQVISDMLKKMLEKNGHEVFLAIDGKSGLELYKKSLEEKEPFDLVITDLGMPGLDGISISKEIKRLTSDIPVILLTGWGSLIIEHEHPSIDYLLKKPIMREDLLKAINELFKDKGK